jgi:hypothetical protein
MIPSLSFDWMKNLSQAPIMFEGCNLYEFDIRWFSSMKAPDCVAGAWQCVSGICGSDSKHLIGNYMALVFSQSLTVEILMPQVLCL